MVGVRRDRPGFLASIAEKVASKGMYIEDLTTELRMGKNGSREFVVHAAVSSPNLSDRDNLEACMQDLLKLKSDLGLSTFDLRAHTA